MGAIAGDDGKWQYKLKVSEQTAKVSTPGVLQVRRFYRDDQLAGDAIYDLDTGIPPQPTIVDPNDMTRRKTFAPGARHEDLLAPIFRSGRLVYAAPPLNDIRRRAEEQVAALHPSIKRFVNPHGYPVGLERNLHELKTKLILQARGVRE